MTFRLTTLLYVFALLAAAMATFGPGSGMLVASIAAVYLFVAVKRSREWRCFTGLMILCAVCFFALSIPARQAAIDSANLGRSCWRCLHITLAFYEYEQTYGQYPPYISRDSNGAPLHGWRTHILSEIEEPLLYKQIKLDEPWDSDDNLSVTRNTSIEYLRSERGMAQQSQPNETHFFAVVDDSNPWPVDVKMPEDRDPKDALKRVLFIEVAGRGVPWYEPRDLTTAEAVDILCGNWSEDYEWIRSGYFVSDRIRGDGILQRYIGLEEGGKRSVGCFRDRELAEALCRGTDDDRFIGWQDRDDIYRAPKEMVIGHIIHWGRIWGLAVFVALAIGPLLKKRPPSDEALLVG